jgi:SRSO17 transposase
MPDEIGAPLQELLGGIGEILGRDSRRRSFASYAIGLLGEGDRKSMEPIAMRFCDGVEHADAAHQRLNHFINSNWSDGDVRRYAADYALSRMLPVGAVQSWIIDDTGFLKQGSHSVGVQRQYTGSAGKVANCQIGVSLVVATAHDHLPVDFELYLPTSWTEDPKRRQEARIPDEVVFQTKIDLAIGMLRRWVDAGVPKGVLLADAWYGDEPKFRDAAEDLGLDYAVGVKSDCRVWVVDSRGYRNGQPMTVAEVAERLGSKAYRRFTWREGTDKKLSARFAFVTVVAANRSDDDPATRPKVRLVIEQGNGGTEGPKYAFVRLSGKPSKKQTVRILKDRWRTERVYEDLKGELGLDHFEGRRYPGWHHHVTIALACYAFTVAERARLFPPALRGETRNRPLASAA